MNSKRKSLEHWVRLLEEQQLPAFAHTARMIIACTRNDDQSASELAALILQDVSMTTRLLRLANSIYYKRSSQRITTVSRAIVVIGLNSVRDLCLSIAVIDTFLHGPHRERVLVEMARSLHAAVQARDLARQLGEREAEEVFIATLLRHLGRLAFWCFANEIDDAAVAGLDEALSNGERSTITLERQHLGFRLDDLTAGLNRAWSLSPLLNDVMANRPRPPRRCQLVESAYEIIEAVEEGYESGAFQRRLKELNRRYGLSEPALRERIETNATDARQVISELGLNELANRIPDPQGRTIAPDGSEEEDAPLWPEPDEEVQMAVLRELSDLLDAAKPNFNRLIDLVLEGVYRGIGLDRCVVALLKDKGRKLQVQYQLGKDVERLASQFAFEMRDTTSLVVQSLAERRTLWIDERKDHGDDFSPDSRIETISGGSFFLMPLTVEQRSIGCLYADCKPSGRALSAEQFQAFRVFGQQIRLALSVLAK